MGDKDKRISDLLEANNRYLNRARQAEWALRDGIYLVLRADALGNVIDPSQECHIESAHGSHRDAQEWIAEMDKEAQEGTQRHIFGPLAINGSPKPSWNDKDDQWARDIADAHPVNAEAPVWDCYNRAMELVGNRHSKYALVDLTNWLLLSILNGDQTPITGIRKEED